VRPARSPNLGLEVLVLDAATGPRITALRQVWMDRLGGLAAPLLAIALRGDTAVICGPAGEDPPIHRVDPNGRTVPGTVRTLEMALFMDGY
jgi:hypothetical protein